MQAYIDRNISVCLHFYGFRHTKNVPSTFMDKRAIENIVENAVFLQWLNQHTHIAYAAYYTIKTSRSEREYLETHHGVCKTQH